MAADLYLLIHPEVVSNEPAVALGEPVEPEMFPDDLDDLDQIIEPLDVSLTDFCQACGDLDETHGQAIVAGAEMARRRAVIVDSLEAEELLDDDGQPQPDGQIICALPVQGWQVGVAGAGEVGPEAVRLAQAAGARSVLIGGYARHDCVARSVRALEAAGFAVELHEPSTLPLSSAGAQWWASGHTRS